MTQLINHSSTKPHILFDFDGTIADSMPVLIHIYRELSRKYNLNFATDAEILTWRSLSARQILQRSGLSVFKIIPLIKEGKAAFSQHLHLVKPIQGMPDVLHQLSQTHHLGIVTSNSTETVQQFIQQHNLPDFEFIHSDKTLFGKGSILKKVVKQHDINPEITMYVGDEIRDIQAARVAKMPCLAVTWGLNSHEVLQKHQPYAIIDQPQQLITHLKA